MPIFNRIHTSSQSGSMCSSQLCELIPECMALGCHQPLILNSRDIPQVWMLIPQGLDALLLWWTLCRSSTHLGSCEKKNEERGGGNRNPVLFFQQKQQSTLNILNIPQMDGEESNKKGGSRRRFQNLDVLAEKFRRHRHVLFFVICYLSCVICYLLFVFGNFSKSTCCIFLTQTSMSQVIQSDLFITQLEVTNNPLKGSHFHHPKKVTLIESPGL